MDPITITVVLFVARAILNHHIKETWVGKILPSIFPIKTYQTKLEQLLTDTIVEFRKKYPKEFNEGKIQFFEDKDTFEKMSMYVLFKQGQNEVLVSDFKNKRNIIAPTQNEIEYFYQYFIEKANADNKLRNIYINEKYKEEIFNISRDLERLSGEVLEIKDITTEIKSDTSQLLINSEDIKDGIKSISDRFGSEVEVSSQLVFARTEVHPLVENLSKRVDTVDGIIEILNAKSWFAINGSISTGKTQLAILISERYGLKTHWIGLRGLESNNYFGKIVYDLCASFEIQPNLNFIQLVEEIVNALTNEDLIVLDDIPKLDGRTKADELFVSFIKKCMQKEVKLISTSNFEIPSNIKLLLPEKEVEFTNVPFLSEIEVKEVLSTYGAKDEIAEILKKLIRTISYGHPTIVTALSRYLSAKYWIVNEDELIRLFKGDISTELIEETYEKISRTIIDPDARELLFRLNLINGSFTTEEVTIVCNIKPLIKSFIGQFHSVIGLWVQKTTTTRYELSPLIKHLKSSNLNFELVHRINYALGKAILDKKKLNQFDAPKAILYFVGAQAFNDAGFVLILVLNESLKNPQHSIDWGTNLFWHDVKLPEKMDLFVQMHIRILQLMLDRQKGVDLNFLNNDLELIVEKASKKGISISSGALLLSSLYASENPSKSCHYFILGIRNYNELKKIDFSEKELSKDYVPEQMVWIAALGIKTKTEIANWFNAFEQLIPEQRQKSIEAEIIDLGSLIIGKNLITEEENKTDIEQDWEGVLNALEYLQNKAEEFSLDLLVANAIRYRINVLSEKLFKIEDAFSLAEKMLPVLSGNFTAQFLVKDAIGRQLFYCGKKNDALSFIIDAIAIEVDDFYVEKLDTYLVYSQLLGEKDEKSAHFYSGKALNFARGNQFFTDVLRAKIIGEYAVSLSLIGRIKDAIFAAEEGYQILLDSYDNSVEYKNAVLRYGHVSNYWRQIIITGTPPALDGLGEPYQPPERGIFINTYKPELIEKYYFPERRFATSYMFFNCFEELGDYELSKKWAYNNLSINRDIVSNIFYPIINSAIPYLIIDGQYDEAINYQVKIIEDVRASSKNPERHDVFVTNEYLKSVLKNKPNIKIDQNAKAVFDRMIVPLALSILTNIIDQRERTNEIVEQFADLLKRWVHLFSDEESLPKIIELFNGIQQSIDGKLIIEKANTYKGDLSSSIGCIGYLIASLSASSIEALRLHLMLIELLERKAKDLSQGAYTFILIPFFEKFWFKRYSEMGSDFSDPVFWKSNSLPFYERANLNEKLKKLFKILCHHLDYEPATSKSEWLDS